MNYTKNENLAETLLDEMMAEIEDKTRQHPSVSDLIYCLTKKWLDNKYGENPTTKTKLYFSTGLAFERTMLVARRGVPTTGSYEGIHYHIDSLDDGVMEFKSTRARPAENLDKISDSWLKQIMAYCKTQNLTHATLAVLHIIQPELVVWDLDFTQEEIDDNWCGLQLRKIIWDEATLEDRAPEPFKWNQSWECKDCTYKVICDARSSGLMPDRVMRSVD